MTNSTISCCRIKKVGIQPTLPLFLSYQCRTYPLMRNASAHDLQVHHEGFSSATHPECLALPFWRCKEQSENASHTGVKDKHLHEYENKPPGNGQSPYIYNRIQESRFICTEIYTNTNI